MPSLIVINAISGTGPAVTAVIYKLGLNAPKGSPAFTLLSSLSWLVVIVWLASMATFRLSAGLLIAGRSRAFVLFTLAYVSDLFVFPVAQGPAYEAAFSRGQKVVSYIVFVFLIPIGIAVWYLQRTYQTEAHSE